MNDPKAIIQRIQAQAQANRYAFLIRQLNARLADNIRTGAILRSK